MIQNYSSPETYEVKLEQSLRGYSDHILARLHELLSKVGPDTWAHFYTVFGERLECLIVVHRREVLVCQRHTANELLLRAFASFFDAHGCVTRQVALDQTRGN